MTSSATGFRVPEPAVSPPAPAIRRRSRGAMARSVLSQTFLSLVALLFLVPIIWMVLSALKPSAEVFTVPPKPFGSSIMFGNFAEAWNYLPFGRFIVNTIFVASVAPRSPWSRRRCPGTRSPGSTSGSAAASSCCT